MKWQLSARLPNGNDTYVHEQVTFDGVQLVRFVGGKSKRHL